MPDSFAVCQGLSEAAVDMHTRLGSVVVDMLHLLRFEEELIED